MYSFDVYEMPGRNVATLAPLSAKREWATNLPYPHAYKCFPLTSANQFGWGISFPDDIMFRWNGKWDASPNNIEVFSGHKWVNFNRGWGIVSFNTGLVLKTSEDLTMLGYPVPNQFIDGFQVFTSLISTSFFQGPWQVAGQITRPKEMITIKAGTPVGALMPMPLGKINESVATKKPFADLNWDLQLLSEYNVVVDKANRSGEVTNFYRDGVNHKNDKLGEHEVKSIKLWYT
jgi:hypothetical protein